MAVWGEFIPHPYGQLVIEEIKDKLTNPTPSINPTIDFEIDISGVNDPKYPDAIGHYRLEFTFKVDPQTVDLFFSTPEGLRGHYYFSPELGDQFAQRCIEAFKPTIRQHWEAWRNLDLFNLIRGIRDPNERLRIQGLPMHNWDTWFDVSLANGKIWPKESSWAAENFVQLFSDEKMRWFGTENHTRKIKHNMRMLKNAISRIDPNIDHVAAASYAHKGILGARRPMRWDTIEIKGGFVDPIGLSIWTHPTKRFQALEIQYMGFS